MDTAINEFKNLLQGEWNNEEFTIGFVSNETEGSDGTIFIYNKKSKQDFGANYRVNMMNGLPHLFIIAKGTRSNFFLKMFIKNLKAEPENKLCLVLDVGGELAFNKVVVYNHN